MKKSIAVLQEIKKYLTILSPLLIFAGAICYIALDLTTMSTNPALKLLSAFGIGMFAFMAVNIVQIILIMIDEKKSNTAHSQKEICKSNFINRTYNFLLKYEKIFDLVFSVICLVLSVMLFSLLFWKGSTQFWNVYYYLDLLQVALVIYAIFSIFISKSKKSLIINCILTSLLFGLTIWTTINAHTMMFGDVGAYSNMIEHNVLLIIYSVLLFLPFGFISTRGDFDKFHATTNFGLGFLGLCIGVFSYEVKALVQRLLQIYVIEGYENYAFSYLQLGHTIAYILLGVVFTLFIVNALLNLRKFIRTKNCLGLLDLVLGTIGLILCIIGLHNFTLFLLYIKY